MRLHDWDVDSPFVFLQISQWRSRRRGGAYVHERLPVI